MYYYLNNVPYSSPIAYAQEVVLQECKIRVPLHSPRKEWRMDYAGKYEVVVFQIHGDTTPFEVNLPEPQE